MAKRQTDRRTERQKEKKKKKDEMTKRHKEKKREWEKDRMVKRQKDRVVRMNDIIDGDLKMNCDKYYNNFICNIILFKEDIKRKTWDLKELV